MENCNHKGKTVCTFDLKDESGLYYEDMVLEWKQAAAERLLTCTECGAHVYLAAGPIKEPYFAHYDIKECTYASAHETEELKKGKRLLYYLLKRSFPNSCVQARYRMENGFYSTLFCECNDGNLIAVDFRLQNNNLEKFQLRDSYYLVNHIIPVYVMGIRQDKNTKQIDWYQNLIQSSMGYLAFLDTDSEKLLLKKSFSYRLGRERKFDYCKKSYQMKELLVVSNGHMACDFAEECRKIEVKIHKEKEQYKMLLKRKQELKDYRDRMALIENEKMNRYRTMRESKEKMGQDFNKEILEKCKKMIKEGNSHLVSKKYYDVIMRNQRE